MGGEGRREKEREGGREEEGREEGGGRKGGRREGGGREEGSDCSIQHGVAILWLSLVCIFLMSGDVEHLSSSF